MCTQLEQSYSIQYMCLIRDGNSLIKLSYKSTKLARRQCIILAYTLHQPHPQTLSIFISITGHNTILHNFLHNTFRHNFLSGSYFYLVEFTPLKLHVNLCLCSGALAASLWFVGLPFNQPILTNALTNCCSSKNVPPPLPYDKFPGKIIKVFIKTNEV